MITNNGIKVIAECNDRYIVFNPEVWDKQFIKPMKLGEVTHTYSIIKIDHLSGEILDIIFPIYPRWEKMLIKRKYGNRSAVYLDVWLPYKKRLTDYLPKVKNYGLSIIYPTGFTKISDIV